MTSSLPDAGGRAALVSPGAALAPLDTEARVDYRQERVALLARVFCSLGAFFLLAGCVHRFVFFRAGLLSGDAFDPALLTHLGVMAFQGLVWLSAQRRFWTERELGYVDGGFVLVTLSAQSYQISQLGFGHVHHWHLLMTMTTLAALLCRAVIVPSRTLPTAVIGVLSSVPALVSAYLDGASRGMLAEAVSFTSIWVAAAVALSAFTSHVIYGLRESVAMARQFGQYVIERRLGAGGMGEVYLARHSLLRRPTAVKLLPPERAGQKTVERFEREVRATSRLSHPNTVSIYDYGRTCEGIFYYAMEYLEGVDLQQLVRDEGPLPPERAVRVLSQIAGALGEAHGLGLVHRDLKPANVVVCERGGEADTVKVLDFGLVKDTTSLGAVSAQTDVNVLIGTPGYISPESIHSPASVGAASDIYALGALGYFLLTGTEVFPATSVVASCIAHLHEAPESPSKRLGRELPASLEALILSCLEKTPEKRPTSALALRRALLA